MSNLEIKRYNVKTFDNYRIDSKGFWCKADEVKLFVDEVITTGDLMQKALESEVSSCCGVQGCADAGSGYCLNGKVLIHWKQLKRLIDKNEY